MPILLKLKHISSSTRKILFLLFLTVVILAVLLGIIWSKFIDQKYQLIDASEVSVVFGDHGFTPEEIIIKKGTLVTFTTAGQTDFWPASNLHPTHLIYPEFDPKRAIAPGQSWQFRFDRVGKWRYHDHLNPSYTGVITVVDGIDAYSNNRVLTVGSCQVLSSLGQKQQCWDNLLEDTLHTKGLAEAFNVFSQLYNSDPLVQKNCHGLTHVLGSAAYKAYAKHKDFELIPETSYCGYGFYHTFIGSLIQDTGNFQKTKEFCDYVRNKLGNEIKNVYNSCIHGVGHGTTAWLLDDMQYWGNFDKTAHKGISLCDSVFPEDSVRNCYDGVFYELEQELYQSTYDFSLTNYVATKDPFYYCRHIEQKYQQVCVYEFVDLLSYFLPKDASLARNVNFLKMNISNPDDRTMYRLISNYIYRYISNDNYSRYVQECRSAPGLSFQDCLRGFLYFFNIHGESGKEYTKGLAFCKADYLTENERDLCFNTFLASYKSTYNQFIFSNICNQVNSKYQALYCKSS